MHITRVFKRGDSQVVRVPAELAFERTDIELDIEREGDEILIRPARRTLGGVSNKFARFSPDFMAEGREEYEQGERDTLNFFPKRRWRILSVGVSDLPL